MKTLLDEFYSCFLHAVVYTERALQIVVAEGFRALEPEDVTIGTHVIKDTYAVAPADNSRLVEVRFDKPIAWQLVDESFTTFDEYEVRDDTASLQVMTQSRYLAYVRANHGWFEDIRGKGAHYRVWTENEVVDIIACEPPTVSFRTSQ